MPHSKWEQEIGIITEQQWTNYNNLLASVKEIKLKDFQYKITNKILVTKSFLYRINKVDDNSCDYCHQQPETIYHLFVECEKVKAFWGQLNLWLSTNSNISIDLEPKNILFSYQDKNVLKSYICIIVKHYIYVNKFGGKELSVDYLISILLRKFQNERYLAYINHNMTKFLAKWLPLYDYFYQRS